MVGAKQPCERLNALQGPCSESFKNGFLAVATDIFREAARWALRRRFRRRDLLPDDTADRSDGCDDLRGEGTGAISVVFTYGVIRNVEIAVQ